MAAAREATGDGPARPFNNLLRRLSAGDFALIEPHLAQEVAGPNDLLYNPGDHVEIVHFPCGPKVPAGWGPETNSQYGSKSPNWALSGL